jgi:hypothetical protein
MSFRNYSFLAGCLLLANAAVASTIVDSTGNSLGGEPLGYYAPYESYGLTPIVYAVEWSQSATYTDVDVTADLYTPGSPGTVDYSLVTAIGAGTSLALDEIAGGTVATPTNPASVNLFQLNSLGPGTYYLVLDSTAADTTWLYNYPGQGSYTTASGVTFLGDDWSYGSSIDTTYTPGSSFSGTTLPVEFSVSGNVVAPEPATLGMSGLVLAGMLALVIRSRRGARLA